MLLLLLLSPPLEHAALQCTVLHHLAFSSSQQPHHSSKNPQILIPNSSKEARHAEVNMILVPGEINLFLKKTSHPWKRWLTQKDASKEHVFGLWNIPDGTDFSESFLTFLQSCPQTSVLITNVSPRTVLVQDFIALTVTLTMALWIIQQHRSFISKATCA